MKLMADKIVSSRNLRDFDFVRDALRLPIDGHHRGNDDVGYVTKERHVEFAGGGVRRGFAVPRYFGKPGERAAAVHL